ncbi:MAG: hypothetical protein CBC35_05635 [Planctomycetes bacterium TMED75]|nr:hypothetical protein [Planctomycetaceae bacterium]OUU93412.1 MAG: hypothetical protein CBC35_05635 [Planctomycetes bacterium TMED75]
MSRLLIQLVVVSQLVWSGCSGTPKASPSTEAPPATSGLRDGLPRSNPNLMGIELLAWRVADTSEFNQLLNQYTNAGLEPADQRRYLDNDIRILRGTEQELEQILASTQLIGGSRSTWCGQILDWRAIVEARTGRKVIEIQDEKLLVDNGTLSMAGRMWVEHSLDGASTRIELVPRYESDIRSPVSVLRASRKRNHTFTNLAAESMIPAGQLLIITSGFSTEDATMPAPMAQTTEENATDPENSAPRQMDDLLDTSEPTGTNQEQPRNSARIQASTSLGGAFFIRRSGIPDTPRERLVVIVVPRIPPGMLPGTSQESGVPEAAR